MRVSQDAPSFVRCYPSALTFMPARSRIQPLHIAIDTGGTFTDCVWVDRGQVRMLKVFSTPADPSQAIVEALAKLQRRSDSPDPSSFCMAPQLAQILCCSAKARVWLWSLPPVLKTPSKSAARPGPSFTISSLIGWSRSSLRICALGWTNAPPATAKSFRRLPHKTCSR